ncbi:hypothetical protein [Microbulbifer thermotolerans]|uniref:Lipoprotein n=1 Tax=Microbulbifer thermotolerans TaxID=252514 RepID=A0AB35HVU8_MICTH|nr:hypothetical protein [Microbulbifer thermotolerans]MCX2779461.1 hypothetical protein [Microbulbifer thermotolerans]MCX2784027.1 hypothetical protein [Microbulbifer thermotolerans]MCX2793332.1 hypothetical protein [Microbulbifer thermotolerans]MCX2801270.1 hypothetical protein [Microbulbifer thermotolerans]MCX2806094.1 hypothetical protein [Microbulbifer thermotolerans]
MFFSKPSSCRKLLGNCLLLVAALTAGACTTTEVRTTAYTPLTVEDATIPEERLLDVGIVQFNPGLDTAEVDEDQLVFPELRQAESRYIAVTLAESLQQSLGWGAVRVIPSERTNIDVTVTGRIVQSDGETLTLDVTVTDSRGQRWFSKQYSELASHYAYDRKHPTKGDAFQGIYNRIANDMLAYRKKLSDRQIAELRTISEMRFARSFSPDAFQRYLVQGEDGIYRLTALPAENDPMLERVRRIRERDYLFVDTLQDYYGTFVKSMEVPYQEWRAMSYEETKQMRELKRKARNHTILGAAAIIGGIAAAGSGGGSARAAGQVGIAGGGYLIKSGFDRRAEAKMHIEALQELGDSIEAEVEPQIVELEDRTVTLTGTVENQYRQWREILKQIYEAETGMLETSI